MRGRRAVLLPWLVVAAGPALACDPAPPPAKRPAEEVPANSLDRSKLAPGDSSPSTPENPSRDPSQPYTVPVDGRARTASSASSSPAGQGKPEPRGRGSQAASRAECERAMDHYLDLEIRTNPQLAGVGAEVIAAAKQMARDKHGEAPCTATAAQTTCAIAATSTDAWQTCMR